MSLYYWYHVGIPITKGAVSSTSSISGVTQTINITKDSQPATVRSYVVESNDFVAKPAPSKKLLREIHKQNIRRGWKR